MSTSRPSSTGRVALLAILGLLVLGGGVGLGVSSYRQAHGPVTIAPTAAPPVAPAGPTPGAPAFDVVRVAPDGGAVLAGRAEPGATVTVQENGRTVGTALSDRRGAWVMVPDAKLAPGAGELTLSAQGPSGPKEADAPVLVMVPTPAAPGAPVLALLAPPAAPSRVLQVPGASAPGHKLGLDTVDYDEHGAIRFSGTAPPDAAVRVYVDNTRSGDAKAGADGHWAMSPPGEVPPGVHTLRLDQLTGEGRVAARIETPFQREALAQSQVANGQVVVQPGQNLWRLARRAYGSGIRYTVIFLANRDQIRDVRLIYPGQVFAMPDGTSMPVTPVVSLPGASH